MPGIYIMAVITVMGSSLLAGTYLQLMSGQPRRYLWLLLISLPLSTLINLLVKRPLIVGLGGWANIQPGQGLATPLWFIGFAWLLSPLSEEAIKLTPFLLPRVRVFLETFADTLWAGFALGVGFGLGEAAYLAWGIAQNPAYLSLPWYMFGGYAGERLIVCFVHGMMTGLAALGIRQGGQWAWLGYLAAVGLHALLNLGPVLLSLDLISGAAASLTLVIPLVLMVFIFERLRRLVMQKPDAPDLAQEVVYFKREEP